MPVTAATILPIRPVFVKTASVQFTEESSAGIVEGDLITESAGTAGTVEVRNASAIDIAIGFARASSGGVCSVYLCFPGVIFNGNITKDDDENVTGVLATHCFADFAIIEATSAGLAVLQGTGGTAIVTTLQFGTQIDGTTGPSSGVDVTNPRVNFVVNSSIWANRVVDTTGP